MQWIYAIGPSLLVVIGGIVTWVIQNKYGKLRDLEEKLREDRLEIYKKLLEPYFKIIGSKSPKEVEDATKIVLSYEYRKNAFIMRLLGSDEVIRAHNNLMQHFYKNPEDDNLEEVEKKERTIKLIKLFGKLIIEIRKDFGNRKTKLEDYETFSFMITDIDKYLNKNELKTTHFFDKK
ncbi:MAG: PX domain-containing protein [Candidatus Humimicrobiaceae bacterium]